MSQDQVATRAITAPPHPIAGLLVSDVMTDVPATIHVMCSVRAAMRIFAGRSFQHLPVVAGRRVVGIISDRDIQGFVAKHPKALDMELCVAMTASPTTVRRKTPLVEAARLLIGQGIHCLPVTDDMGAPVGIVTSTDVLRAFVRACAENA